MLFLESEADVAGQELESATVVLASWARAQGTVGGLVVPRFCPFFCSSFPELCLPPQPSWWLLAVLQLALPRPWLCCSPRLQEAKSRAKTLLLLHGAAGRSEQLLVSLGSCCAACFGIPTSNRGWQTQVRRSQGQKCWQIMLHPPVQITSQRSSVVGSPLVPDPGFYLQNSEIAMGRVHAIQQSNNVAKE